MHGSSVLPFSLAGSALPAQAATKTRAQRAAAEQGPRRAAAGGALVARQEKGTRGLLQSGVAVNGSWLVLRDLLLLLRCSSA